MVCQLLLPQCLSFTLSLYIEATQMSLGLFSLETLAERVPFILTALSNSFTIPITSAIGCQCLFKKLALV